MRARASYVALVITVAVLAGGACTSQKAADEQKATDEQKKIEALQAQLDAAKQQLAAKEAEPQAAQTPPAAPAAVEPQAAPVRQATGARSGARKSGASAATSPARAAAPVPDQPAATQPGQDQGNALTEQQANALAEQRRLNESQAETNAQLQRQLEEMKPVEYTIPAGTVIPVRTTTELSTSNLATGSTFDAILERDIVVDGTVLASQGSHVTGVVASSDPGGKVKGVASLAVTIRSITGRRDHAIRVKADQHSVDAPKTTGRDAARTGIMTGAGAIVGAIAGGGKGAAIGAGAGAATGVGTSMATRGKAAVIPAETLMNFRLAAPATVVYQR
jgi:hypothetical protein